MLLWSQWFYQYLQPQPIKRTGSVYTAQLLCFMLIESNSRLTFHGLMDLMVLLKSKLFNFPVFYVFPSLGKYIIWPNCGLIRFENYQILFLRWLYKKKMRKEVHTGTPNSDASILCIVQCERNMCPHKSWRERSTALMWYYSPKKNKLIYQVRANTNDFWLSGQYGKYNSNIFLLLGPFPSKMMRTAPELYVFISSHCSTPIWRMR